MPEYHPTPQLEAWCRAAAARFEERKAILDAGQQYVSTPTDANYQLADVLTLTQAGYNPTYKHFLADSMLVGKEENMLLVGGSRSGKTFTFCKAIAARALNTMERSFSRHAILRRHLKDVSESVGMDTWPKMMRLRYPGVSWRHHNKNQGGIITICNKLRPKEDWPEIWLLGLDDKDRVDKVLGKEFATLFFNECSEISYSSIVTAESRLAQKVPGLINRVYYDLNPVGTGHFTYALFVDGKKPNGSEALADPSNYVYLYLNPLDNEVNVAAGYIQRLMRMPDQQRKRFFEGRYVAALPGALWTIEGIEVCRLRGLDDPLLPEMRRIVVAVDPSGAKSEDDTSADEIGIVAAGLGVDDHVYLLEDLTGLYSPEGWARVVVDAYFRWKADRVVAEKNYGGDMVRAVIQGARDEQDRPIGKNVPYRDVDATRGKVVRAEPISAMQERGMVHHVGHFPLLERELTNFTAAGYKGSRSPNRADAFVWAATELFGRNLAMGLVDFIKGEQQRIDAEMEAKMKAAAANLAPTKLDTDTAQIAKVDTVPNGQKAATVTCPGCGGSCIGKVASGGMRCGSCGTQFGAPERGFKPMNRSSLIK